MASLLSFGGGRPLTFTVKVAADALSKAFLGARVDFAKAATEAMREIEPSAKADAREAIRKGGPGFRGRWPNALRTQVYPKKGVSLQPSLVMWVRSPYAGIFEKGGTIRGAPFIWLPLKGVPLRYRGERLRPGNIRGLVSIRRPGKPPLLGIRVKTSAARAEGPITTSLLSRGTAERYKAKKRGAKLRIRVIPLFVGIRSATITKKWDISGARDRAARLFNSRLKSKLRG
ncbi:MAG: DUF6441 family protein [Armatimonadia bacterium]